MEFIGRERELAQLEDIYSRKGFQMVVIYGRRRVGKTDLIKKFAEGRRCIFFTAVESDVRMNIENFGESIFECFSMGDSHPHFASFDEAFGFIADRSGKERIVVVIDEYPYLAEADRSISSVLQRQIDLKWQDSNIFLILCGSSVSFMEEEVLGSKSPLFGRRTAQMDVRPFDYRTAAEFVPGYNAEDRAIVYGVTGGIAKYLSLFDGERSLDENIRELFFSDIGYMYEEPLNLLRQEFRNIPLYSSIIEAVAKGAGQMNEIASRTGFTTAQISQAIDRLISVRIAKKDIPLLNEKNKRLSQYVIDDGMFRFWYRFVLGAVGSITRGYGYDYYDNRVRPVIHEFMGAVFEEMCREYAFRLAARGELHTDITDIGRWRGQDTLRREPADIDVVGLDRAARKAVIGECKFRNESPRAADIETCIERARLLGGYEVRDILFFSLKPVDKRLQKKYGQVRFVTLTDMYA